MDSTQLFLGLFIGVLLGLAGAYFWLNKNSQKDREKDTEKYEQKIRDLETRLQTSTDKTQNEREQLIRDYENQYRSERERLIREHEQKMADLQQNHQQAIEEARKESVDQSRSTLKGKMAEQTAPLLPGFSFLPADARFLGDPIDYVVFHGYSRARDKNANLDALEVVIVDIKQGAAQLSPAQRAIARAIEEGRVRFDVVRIFDDGSIKSHTWYDKRKKPLPPVTS